MTAAIPVEIKGFAFERTLGGGGYANVHLYTQALPHRYVAVKVLRQTVDDPVVRRSFESEANVMAALSTHPSILTIYQAAITDDGVAYLVMEYCSRPTLADRYTKKPLSVPEMLQTLIRLSGAVETAHRGGVLHRDIKPANVLTTDYGWPALTDFGIASMVGESGSADDALSLSWAAPEAISARSYDARSDVYALAATAYTTLAGHAPFDDGSQLDTAQLAAKILTDAPPPIQREDVPDGLHRLLTIALSKNPAERPQTAMEFARGLQVIEQELHLPITQLDVPADPLTGLTSREDGESTQMSSGVGVSPRGGTLGGIGGAATADDQTVLADRSRELLAPVVVPQETRRRTAFSPSEDTVADRTYRPRSDDPPVLFTRTPAFRQPASDIVGPPRVQQRSWLPALIIACTLGTAGAVTGIIMLLGTM